MPKTKTKVAQPSISVALRKEIVKRAKSAFRAFDRNTGETVARCHNVSKRELVYRLPADVRTQDAQGLVIRREGKNIIVSKTTVVGFNPR